MAFKAEFILEDNEIIWRLDENALKKISILQTKRNNGEFKNSAIGKTPKKSLLDKNGIYTLSLEYMLKTEDISSISLLAVSTDDPHSALASDPLIKNTKTEAFKLFKDYLICFCNKTLANSLKEDQLDFKYNKNTATDTAFKCSFSLVYSIGAAT